MNITTHALEYPVHFLSEQRSKAYKRYVLGVAQLKNVLGAHSSLSVRAHPSESKTKNGLQRQALPGLVRRGA